MDTFSKEEEKILKYWKEIDAFNMSMELSKGRKEFSFYDGPPFATGLPHYGHILAGTIKDTITRFFYQQGHYIERRFGWDCHGLPIEYEIDKIYGIKTKKDVEDIGVAKYNEYCKNIVMKYSGEWEEIVNRMGRWIDFKNGYKTMDFTFMESVWAVFKALFDKNLVYRGYRVMPYSTRCRTPMSNFEANQNYKEVSDLTATVRLPLIKPLEIEGKSFPSSLLVWTTTPWTLPSNSAVLVNPDISYVLAEDKQEGSYIVIGEFAAKKKKVLHRFKGSFLINAQYKQPFKYFEDKRKEGYFQVYGASFVQEGAGTGLVHCAPGFGEEDHNAFVENGLIEQNGEVICPVDDEGKFTEEVADYAGQEVKECNKDIIKLLKEKELLYESGSVVHSYPFCWRSDTPLIYKAVPSWFVQVKHAVKDLVEKNKEISWSPKSVGVGKFGAWLENARDWSISRNRYWGTPIPIWIREGAQSTLTEKDIICIGSAKELSLLSGREITDLHKDKIDDIVLERNGEKYVRTEEVLDCWFESGSMPYAQKHYPFENQDAFKETFPAHFISEGLDQTRGWFYTLHVLSVLLHDSPAFKNVMVTGLVLASDGKKMSKRLKNYPDPCDVMNTHGADAMRMYLISSTVVKAENLRFTEEGVAGLLRDLLIPWQNCLRFAQITSGSPTSGCVVEDIAEEVANLSIQKNEEDNDGPMLDIWIIQELQEFALFVQKEGKSYRIQNIIPRAIFFLGDLSRWYIRLSRERLRGTPMHVLSFVLKGFSVIMAPFAPFFSEKCFQTVKNGLSEGGIAQENEIEDILAKYKEAPTPSAHLSVHFQLYDTIISEIKELNASLMKKVENTPEKILENFRQVKSIIEAVRILREKNNLSLKMPVKEITIIGEAPSKALSKILSKECNALSSVYKDSSSFSWTESLLPNFKAISSLHGGNEVQKRAETIRQAANSKEFISTLLEKGCSTHNGLTIKREEVFYKREASNLPQNLQGISASDSIYVIVDISQDAVTQDLWIRREVKSAVQKLRKKAGLKLSDKAILSVKGIEASQVICDPNTEIVSYEVEGCKDTLNLGNVSLSMSLALLSKMQKR
ncbi:isoleucyl-tRNA synthetase [Nematocida sp. LUAm3]|nr:isoleucyl-tRNA synthetase [Nematocida sp. LUAm3]KAI5174121.1 isoleucyl-tRNA synthetase [Nematocida sp. LUAm2]KAI5177136.1 isoleucyl-tRNA synthetase [Nematocida sp. LUAm1]